MNESADISGKSQPAASQEFPAPIGKCFWVWLTRQTSLRHRFGQVVPTHSYPGFASLAWPLTLVC
jgi:hypothetical protein